MARGPRNRQKEREWRQHVAAWRRSGWSVRAYCESAGLSEPSFYAWRRALADPRGDAKPPRGGTATDSASAAPVAASAFLPVRLVEAAPVAPSAVEVVLRGGRVLRVSAGFAAETLRAVVAALEDLPC